MKRKRWVVKGRVEDTRLKKKGRKKGRKSRLRWSNFAMTTNTQLIRGDHDERTIPDKKKLKNILTNVFQSIKETGYFMKILDPGVKWEFGKTIESAQTTFEVETGKLKKNLHAHILFRVQHRTRLQINYDDLYNELNHAYAAAFPDFEWDPDEEDSKASFLSYPKYIPEKNLMDNWKEYIRKYDRIHQERKKHPFDVEEESTPEDNSMEESSSSEDEMHNQFK